MIDKSCVIYDLHVPHLCPNAVSPYELSSGLKKLVEAGHACVHTMSHKIPCSSPLS